MANQEISLKWNGYQSNILSNVKELFNDEKLTDVTLVCDGKSFKAHKVILSANSLVFKSIFQQNHYENPIIVLHDINITALKTILSFVYNGEVNVTEEFLPTLLKTAESLRICGLSAACDGNKEDEKVATATKPKKRKKSENEDNNNKIKKPSSIVKIDSEIKSDVMDSDKTNMSIIKVEPQDSPLTDYSGDTNDTDIAFVEDSLEKKFTISQDRFSCQPVCNLNDKCSKKWVNEVSSTQPCLNVINVKSKDSEDDKESIEIDKEIETVLQSGAIVESLNIAPDNMNVIPEVLACKDKSAYYANPSFPCPFCPRIYYSWGYRRRHVKSKHTNDKLTCKRCLIELNSTGSWYSHTTKIHGMPHEEARNSLVVMVEAHAVLTLNEPSVTQLLGQVNMNDTQNEITKNKE